MNLFMCAHECVCVCVCLAWRTLHQNNNGGHTRWWAYRFWFFLPFSSLKSHLKYNEEKILLIIAKNKTKPKMPR